MARNVRRLLGLAVLAFALPAAASHASFHAVDGALNVDLTRDALDASIASIGGVPHVAWRETTGILGGLVFVKRFDGTNWVPVGGALNVDVTKGASFPMIASVGGVPYATWEENDGSKFQIRVARFDGTAWNAVGPSLNIAPLQAGTEPSIASVGGVPYVAWTESTTTVNQEQVHVRRLNGMTWDVVGTALNVDTAKPARAPRIADVGGVPYVTWFEGITTPQQVYVRRLNGTTWDQVGGSLNVDATKNAVRPNIASIGGAPYVAWREANPVDQIRLKRFDGANWVSVGGVLNVDPNKTATSTPGIAAVGGVPYVTWSEAATTTSQVVVRRFDGADRVTVGGPTNPDPTRAALGPSIAVVAGFPYVAWSDTISADGKIRVARQLPPTCSGASLAVGHDAAATIPLSCFDAISLAIAAPPGHGTLSSINPFAGTVAYTPNRGYTGPDSFSFLGNDGTFDSNVATIALTVAAGPPALAAVSRLRINPHTFPAATRGAGIGRARKRRSGTTVSYRDTQAATTTLTVLQPARGIRRGRSCVKPRRGQRGSRCTRYVTVGKFTHRDRAGTNSFHFSGRVRGRKLKPGSYRLQAVPRFAGRNGRAVTNSFRVVR
jgi:hypothetical protein